MSDNNSSALAGIKSFMAGSVMMVELTLARWRAAAAAFGMASSASASE